MTDSEILASLCIPPCLPNCLFCSPPVENSKPAGGPAGADGLGVCTPKLGIQVGSIVQFESELFLVLWIEGFKVWLSDSGDCISSQPLAWLTLTNKTALA